MEPPFPFGFPAATAFYLTLYLATLVIHVVFMNYVLAGSAYLAFFALIRRGDAEREAADPIAAPLREWMPFILSAAITAGIAPLLFLQILYQRQFYTANLLLFHRWMAILPVLIVGFYLLYLLKSRVLAHRSTAWRVAVGCGVFLCFGFTAWSWTENHLLSLHESVWPAQYGSGRLFFHTPELYPRLALWFTGAWPTMAACVAWQHRMIAARGGSIPDGADRRCAGVALGGIVAAIVSAVWYALSVDGALRGQVVSGAFVWYLVAAGLGLLVQVALWLPVRKAASLTRGRLMAISAGLVLTIVGTSVLREARRLAAIDVTLLYARHADAAQVGGLVAFLFFAGLNVVLIAWCIRLVTRGEPRA